MPLPHQALNPKLPTLPNREGRRLSGGVGEQMRKRQLLSKSRVNKPLNEPSEPDTQAPSELPATPNIQAAPDPQSARRYTAICGLISGKSLEDIATECDISTRTLRRWMEYPQFIQEHEKAHQQFLERKRQTPGRYDRTS